MEDESDSKPSSSVRLNRFAENTEGPNVVPIPSFKLGENRDSRLIDIWKNKYWSLEGLERHLRPAVFVKISFRQVVEQAIKGKLRVLLVNFSEHVYFRNSNRE